MLEIVYLPCACTTTTTTTAVSSFLCRGATTTQCDQAAASLRVRVLISASVLLLCPGIPQLSGSSAPRTVPTRPLAISRRATAAAPPTNDYSIRLCRANFPASPRLPRHAEAAEVGGQLIY